MEFIKMSCFILLLIISVVADGVPKRGLGANDDVLITGFGGDGSSVNWLYNWDSNTTNKQEFTEYVPMLWGIGWDHTSAWDAHASSWIAAGSQHLLAFNEPELASQSNLDPTAAADAYRKYMQPFAGKAHLGAPAVTNDGREWMTKFLEQCSDPGCTVDFVPIHWYNPANCLEDFKGFVTDMCKIAGDRPVWITEFQPQGSPDEKASFLTDAISWLDDQQCVDRYAYFGTADNDRELLDNGGPPLSALGTIYAFTPSGGTEEARVSAPGRGGGSHGLKLQVPFDYGILPRIGILIGDMVATPKQNEGRITIRAVSGFNGWQRRLGKVRLLAYGVSLVSTNLPCCWDWKSDV